MKQIGTEIGVNESRVSQLHARAIRRLRDALATVMPAAEAAKAMRSAILEFQRKPRMAKAMLSSQGWTAGGGHATNGTTQPGVVVTYPRGKSARQTGLMRAAVSAPSAPVTVARRATAAAIAR
jgi:hypothetical protein